MAPKISILKVKGINIAVAKVNEKDFISLTDMIKAKDGDFFISDWLRNRNTLEYLGAWESLNNPNFNYGEFATIKDKSGLNNFKISVKDWVKRTNAIGITAKEQKNILDGVDFIKSIKKTSATTYLDAQQTEKSEE